MAETFSISAHNKPFVKIAPWFIIGIVVSSNLEEPPWFISLLLSFILISGPFLTKITKKRYYYRRGYLIPFVFIALGILINWSNTQRKRTGFLLANNYLNCAVTSVGVVEEVVCKNDITCAITISFKYLMDGEQLVDLRTKMILYTSFATKLEEGNLIAVHAKIHDVDPPLNPNQFNYRQYLEQRGIRHVAYPDKMGIRVLKKMATNRFVYVSKRMRRMLVSQLKKCLKEERNLALTSALVLGDKSLLQKEHQQLFSKAGAMHILAVSGMHVGTFYILLELLFIILPGWRIREFALLPLFIIMLWGYGFMTGMSPSVIRACTAYSFLSIGKLFGERVDSLNLLMPSALLILMLEPNLIFQLGFQFSFLAVIGILIIHPIMYRIWKPRYKWIDKFWSATSVAIAAQLVTFPLAIYYFHQFPVYFLLSNWLVVPLAIALFYTTIFYLLITQVLFSSAMLCKVLAALTDLLNRTVEQINRLPNAVIDDIYFTSYEVGMSYLCISVLALFLIYRRRFYLIGTMALVLITSISHSLRLLASEKQQLIRFYSIKNHSAYSIIEGRKNTLLCDSALTEDWHKLHYSVQEDWLHLAAMDRNTLLLDSTCSEIKEYEFFIQPMGKDNLFVQTAQYRMLIVSSNYITRNCISSIHVNSLVLRNNANIQPEILYSCVGFDQLILDSSNKYWYRHKWIKEVEQRGGRGARPQFLWSVDSLS